MKTGKCPKCNQRNVSKCHSSEDRTFRHKTYLKCQKCQGYGEVRRGFTATETCEACNGTGTGTIEVEVATPLPTAMAIYACSDCHYTETYLSDAEFPKSLETYTGWERVSAPADGPFR